MSDDNSKWFEYVKQAKESQPWMKYGRDSWNSDPNKLEKNDGVRFKEGATSKRDWGGNNILRSGNCVSCVYTVMETLMGALSTLGFEDPDNELGYITPAEMQELKEWCFVYDESKRKGIAGGLVELGLGYWVPPQEAVPGDFAQLYDVRRSTGATIFGHSVVIWGQRSGGNALDTYSAENDSSAYGNVLSWRNINHPNEDIDRVWYVARPELF